MEVSRERLKLEDVTYSAAPDGRCRIGVRLEWCGRLLESFVEGVETQHGRVRAAAAATLQAALSATGKRVHLDLMGVKAIHAFDGWIVVVRLQGEAEGKPYRLLGSASCEDDEALTQTAAQAVLDATNRLLSRFVRT